jgi:hypothetical protein
MQIKFVRQVAILVMVLIAVGVCFVDAGAQKRKRRPRRVSPAASPSPTPDESGEPSDPSDPTIVSTADQTGTTRSSTRPAKAKPAPASEAEALRRTIIELSGQVNKLNDKLNHVEEQQRSLVDIERLSRAEQRAEAFRAQLRDVQQGETNIQSQLDQIEYALQPENIDRAVGMIGTTHPEEARDQRRRQLESQRTKVQSQYKELEQGRVRLEAAIATADTEVETLRARLDAANAASVEGSPLPVKILPPSSPPPDYTPPPKTPAEPPR